MKILIAHNTYQNPGGEDVVVQQESAMLLKAGVEVVHLERSNLEICGYGLPRKGLLPFTAVWSRQSYRRMLQALERHRPDLVHIHNTHVLLSPSIVHACKKLGIPVVATLHNWRRLCPASTLYHGHSECTGHKRGNLRCVLDASYRDSIAAGATVLASNAVHAALGTWDDVHHIVMSDFARTRFAEAGVARLHVKPHFVAPDPGCSGEDHGYALYAGSLTENKGAALLAVAWAMLHKRIPLILAGSGPLGSKLSAWAEGEGALMGMQPPVGQLRRDELLRLVRHATFVVVPSQWPEPFGMIAIEALACGVPVIASDAGALPEIVKDGINGLVFPRNSPAALADRVEMLWNSRALRRILSEGARESFLLRYTAEKNYPQLMRVYEAAGVSNISRAKAMPAAV